MLPLLMRRAVRARALSACNPGRGPVLPLGGRWPAALPAASPPVAGAGIPSPPPEPSGVLLPACSGACSGALHTRLRSAIWRSRLSRSAALPGLSGLSSCSLLWVPSAGTATVRPGLLALPIVPGASRMLEAGGLPRTAAMDHSWPAPCCRCCCAAATPGSACFGGSAAGASPPPNSFCLKLLSVLRSEALPILGGDAPLAAGGACWLVDVCLPEPVRGGRRHCSRLSEQPSTASPSCWLDDCPDASQASSPPCCRCQLRTLLCRSLL